MEATRPVPRVGLLLSVLVLLLASMPLAAACSSQSESEKLCSNINDLGNAMKSIQDVKPGSARQDIQKVRDNVQSSVKNIQSSASQVPEIEALKAAITQFEDAVNALPQGVSAGDAVRALAAPFQNLTQAIANARDAVNCK